MRTLERNEPSRPCCSTSPRPAPPPRGRSRRARRGLRRHGRRRLRSRRLPPPPGRRDRRDRLASAAASASAASAVVVGRAGVDDRLDVTDRRGREAHPGGEDRVAGLDALGLLGADRGPLHGLAVVAALGLQRLEHGLGAADTLDRGGEARLRARGARRARSPVPAAPAAAAAAAATAACSSPSATGCSLGLGDGLLDGRRLVGRRLQSASSAACSSLRSSVSFAKNVRRWRSAAVSRRRRGRSGRSGRPGRCPR